MNRREFNAAMGYFLLSYACVPDNVLASQNSTNVKGWFDENLISEHPRLHLRSQQWKELRGAIKTNSLLAQWYATLQSRCDELLRAPTASYRLIGPRLLAESRKALETISRLGLFIVWTVICGRPSEHGRSLRQSVHFPIGILRTSLMWPK